MPANLYFTIESVAWPYLLDLSPHPNRKEDIQFDGHSFIKTEHGQSSKGLASSLIKLLFNDTPNIPETQTYLINPPYSILPQSFVDMREWAESDYVLGVPGQPIAPEAILATYPSLKVEYTNWGTGSTTERHGIYVYNPQLVLRVVAPITDYWHISLPSSRMPKNNAEKFSAFMNAIGLGYLQHANLPHHPNNIPGVRQDAL